MIKTLFTILLFTVSAFALDFTAPTTTAPANSKVTIPLSVTDAADIIAFQGNVVFDPSVLTLAGANHGCSIGDLAEGFTVFCNEIAPGILRFSAYSAYSFDGDGTVLNIKFYTHTGKTNLILNDIMFFDQGGYVEAVLTDGFIGLQ